ncbi:hypothetical protein, partial [Agrobacterium pusense]
MEVSGFDFQIIDMEIRYIDLSRLHDRLWIIPWIRSSSMLDLVAAPMGKREVTEAAVPVPDACEVGRGRYHVVRLRPDEALSVKLRQLRRSR